MEGRVNLERMRAHGAETHAQLAAAKGSRAATLRVVAGIVEDLHIEGRVASHRLESDEPPERGGSGLAPSPLQYFIAGAAF